MWRRDNFTPRWRLSGVLRQLREIEQFVGAQFMGLYFLSDTTTELVQIAGRGFGDGHGRLKPGWNPFGAAFASGAAEHQRGRRRSPARLERPAA